MLFMMPCFLFNITGKYAVESIKAPIKLELGWLMISYCTSSDDIDIDNLFFVQEA